MDTTNGVIQRTYRISDHKVLDMKIVESPNFQCSITQIFYDIDEAERCRIAELPMPEACSLMVCLTQSEMFGLTNFLTEYIKDYQAAMSIIPQKEEQ
jgi:hypothetical protein